MKRVHFALVGAGLLTLGASLLFVARRPATPPTSGRAYAPIPRIDVHIHAPPSQAVHAARLLRQHGGIRIALNASGGHPHGGGLEDNAAAMAATGGAIRPYCSVDFSEVESAGFATYVERTLDACVELGAVGLKISKALGLGYVLSDGSLLRVDDPRLDVVFDGVAARNLPVLIHTGDPQAFFRPDGPENERHAELSAHPSWAFYGPRPDGIGEWPTWQEVFDQFEARVRRSARTTFVGAHFGNVPEEPETVRRMLETYPNLVVETGARIPEMGRFDAVRMREIFVRFADRILFGTDFQMGRNGELVLGSCGDETDPPERLPFFFDGHFRYFETEDRDFAHPTPIQGDWTIDGIGLPRQVLEQLYYRNAMRVYRLPDPTTLP